MNKLTVELLKTAHYDSVDNRDILRNSEYCGCFSCLDQFDYKNIEEWLDDGDTALCPSCCVDAVLGSDSDIALTEEFLQLMQDYWFTQGNRAKLAEASLD
ncbi:cytoplasmic protein [Pseudomonas sp. F1_0610]|uniref:cytoplasmic protein n=1 Tax=Pseudomonas sp. F1_0610 TaxID=3114284 RepID=UPI0039C0EDAC